MVTCLEGKAQIVIDDIDPRGFAWANHRNSRERAAFGEGSRAIQDAARGCETAGIIGSLFDLLGGGLGRINGTTFQAPLMMQSSLSPLVFWFE